ncbi:hypothetical protein [Sphingobacterium sp. 1.A.5]|uniref:hypothetical protein n=1 Tax=Sphingobacterium sp. 1.A.5 TaxID=2044604 RepID=UPI000C0BC7AF|nr:hypothetical protein [Sphingobacterium sp. 1.A.5]
MKNIYASWSEVPTHKFTEIANYKFAKDELTKEIQTLSILSDYTIEEIEKMKPAQFKSAINKISFFESEIDHTQSKFKWNLKKLEDITMDDFISYEKLRGEKENIAEILSFMSVLSVEEIKNMSIVDTLNGFFLLKKHLKRFIQSSLISSMAKTMKLILKEKLQFWKKKKLK